MSVSIEPEDEIARCLIYPQFFEGSIHVNGKLWEFGKRASDGASHQSAVLRRLAANTGDVHRIGCKIAAIGNERLGPEVDPEKKRYYCGFRSALVNDLQLVSDDYRVVITSLPEFGEDAHVDVALFINDDVPRNRHANLRTAAGLALAEAFPQEPEPHRCAVDKDDPNHPFVRLGEGCLSSGLLGPWQGKTVHLTDVGLVSHIAGGHGWPGILVAPDVADEG
jgi:hypothetical protein